MLFLGHFGNPVVAFLRQFEISSSKNSSKQIAPSSTLKKLQFWCNVCSASTSGCKEIVAAVVFKNRVKMSNESNISGA